MLKLYELNINDDYKKRDLYYKCNNIIEIKDKKAFCKQNTVLDFTTYFNCMSIAEWKKYTTLREICIAGRIDGTSEIIIDGYKNEKEKVNIVEEKVDGDFSIQINIEKMDVDIIGVKIIAKKDIVIQRMAYYGEFDYWNNEDITVVICTYKRESYVKNLWKKLGEFNKEWLRVITVDNGRTLEERKEAYFEIIRNKNYGGAGGFTRGIIQAQDEHRKGYVLLLDDDIDIDVNILEKTHALLGGVKEEYKESFCQGAMLDMDSPYRQYEIAAFWEKRKFKSYGKNFDLTKIQSLLHNIHDPDENWGYSYAGWWYCAMPLNRIDQIGYPLPNFLKFDDVEFGVRNNKPIIRMNGIGVWHDVFEKKRNYVVEYFWNRNSFIFDMYINCGRYDMYREIITKIKPNLGRNWKSIQILELAVKDYYYGYDKMLKVAPEDRIKQVNKITNEVCIRSVLKIMKYFVLLMINFSRVKKGYLLFRKKRLMDDRFWKDYLA